MAAGSSSQSLNFKIFQCSSQDPSFPVGELMTQNKDQSQLLGWQSQRFCVFPQEIILQFPCLVHLKQVQFLVHQNKIPSRIELYAYAPDFTALGAANLVSPNNAQISFSRLGHFSLDDNIRTNYQARELKTVYLEQYCQYLKIVVHKNHLNNLNIFNQVGLVSLTCTGAYIGDYEMSALMQTAQRNPVQGGGFVDPNSASQGLMPRNLKIAGVNEDELDETIQGKIRTLSEAKLTAVEEEDFDKAKFLKDAIDKLKLAGSQLVQLELQKRLAIENEDFDSAKVLKFEIERLKNLAMNLDTERVIHQPYQQEIVHQQMSHQQFQPSIHGSVHQSRQAIEVYDQAQDQQQMDVDFMSAHNRMTIDGDDQLSKFEEGKSHHVRGADMRYSMQAPPLGGPHGDEFLQIQNPDGTISHTQRQLTGPQQNLLPQNTLISNKQSYKSQQSNEDMIVPALSMKKPIDFNTVGDEDYNPSVQGSNIGAAESVTASQEELKLSNIPTQLRPIADAMVPVFGEEIPCLVFARAWANREKGITQVIEKMDEALTKDPQHAHGTLLQLMTECLKDKVQQISTKAFQLFEAYISALQSNKAVNPKNEVSNTEKLLVQLLDRLSDTKYQAKAEQCFFQLFNVEQFDGTFLLNFLFKSSSYINKSNASNFRHLIPRLTMVNTLLAEFPKYESKVTQATFPFGPLLAKIKESVDASNPEQRKIALQLIVTMYQQFGYKRVEGLISELPVKHLEALAKDIPEAEAYNKAKKHQPATKKE